LDSKTNLFQSGRPVLVDPKNLDGSRLIQLVRGADGKQMPPDDHLPAAEVAILEKWVSQGAVWPGYENIQVKSNAAGPPDPLHARFTEEQRNYWAFRPIADPGPPPIQNSAWPRCDLDKFVLAKLEEKHLQPSRAADKLALLRRATFDLIGLPPTPEEVSQFLADESPNAFAKVVDRLLASPRYGERWGQHWLDVVRFAESAGHDGNNAYLHAWRYRDYVIKAFNDDKPFDEFIVEQLAGDLLPKSGDAQRDYDRQVAIGFLQVGPKPVVMRDKRQMLLDIADEQVGTIGVSFMGLTIGCARCHDHKFDPIPTADYYSLAGIMMSTEVMADDAPDSKWLEFPIKGPDGKDGKFMAVRDSPHPKNLPIHQRGSYRSLGPETPRQFLQIVAGSDQPAIGSSGSGRLELARWIASPTHPLTARVMANRIWQHHFGRGIVASSGNFGRLGSAPTHPELLDWLAQRFIESGWSVKAMHRLIMLSSTYQQAFADNSAAFALDPENTLLWRMPRQRLSAEEVRDSLLAIAGQLDLTIGGGLLTEGYTPVDAGRELYTIDISGKETYPPFEQPRRSVYLPVIRNSRPEALRLFDVANEHESSSVRGETTVSPQALFLLNSPFVRRMANFLATRALLAGASEATPEKRAEQALREAYILTLGRKPEADEISGAVDFIDAYAAAVVKSAPEKDPKREKKSLSDGYSEVVSRLVDPAHFQAWRAVSQSLFCLNEFVYVD
jgi:hypothetical protein